MSNLMSETGGWWASNELLASSTRAWHCTVSFRKQKEFSQQFTGPGRMAPLPRTGTGDSACRIRHYQCSFAIICQGNFSIRGTFLIELHPPPNIHGWQPQRARFQVVYDSFCDSKPMCSFSWQLRFGSLNPIVVSRLMINWLGDITILQIRTFPSTRLSPSLDRCRDIVLHLPLLLWVSLAVSLSRSLPLSLARLLALSMHRVYMHINVYNYSYIYI